MNNKKISLILFFGLSIITMPIFPSAKVNLHLAHNTITANNYSPNNSMENNYSTNNDCVGVGPWTGMISSYNKSNKTAIIEDTETRKIIEFTDVIEFSYISNEEIMKQEIIKEKDLIFFAQIKNPKDDKKPSSKAKRDFIALWGKIN